MRAFKTRAGGAYIALFAMCAMRAFVGRRNQTALHRIAMHMGETVVVTLPGHARIL